jgi:hypothetical protein
MKLSMLVGDNNKRIVFVWGVSNKATAYKQIKGMFGGSCDLVFMNPGSNILEMSDEQFAEIGLRRMTDDEKIAYLEAKLAKSKKTEEAPAAAAPEAAPAEGAAQA